MNAATPAASAFVETVAHLDCGGEPMLGVVTRPQGAEARTGLLIVVGGPQYRVGAHRQFVQLARSAAARGIAAMRFDCRGMGDAAGQPRSFADLQEDIGAAISAFRRHVPSLQRVVLWGLCDGASAVSLYHCRDGFVAGRILVNPWVYTPAGFAATRLRHYYLRRLFAPAFWWKVAAGRFSLRHSVHEFRRNVLRREQAGSGTDEARPSEVLLPRRMAQSLIGQGRPLAVLLSGRDLVAREFEDVALPMREWRQVFGGRFAAMERIAEADHTLASPQWQAELERFTVRWVEQMARPTPATLRRRATPAESKTVHARTLMLGLAIQMLSLDS